MLKKLYDKGQIYFALLWIALYCILMSAADAISALVGVEKSVTLPVAILLSVLLLVFLKKNRLFAEYGLRLPTVSAQNMLYYLPLLFLLSANFWHGFALNYGIMETFVYILSMICVGFLEEIIFRGLLFRAMLKDNAALAVTVSSLSFGIGHIINLINGSGAELLPNLLQVVYATAAGFMFVMIYYKTDSLLGCIIIHGLFNALSAFSNEAHAAQEEKILTALILTLISGLYALYIGLTVKKNKNE